jgi:drug/metabolite transporter (DMT)-like permease
MMESRKTSICEIANPPMIRIHRGVPRAHRSFQIEPEQMTQTVNRKSSTPFGREMMATMESDKAAATQNPERPSQVENSGASALVDHSYKPMLLGLFAGVTYSVANLALRGMSKPGAGAGWDMWVAGNKALPTFLIAVVLIGIRKIQKKTTFAEWGFVWPIIIAALFNQLGGNFAFQMSLKSIGLAISVPICISSIICSGAIVGRFVLNDRVTIRTAISMGLMIASIVFLSIGAGSRSAATNRESNITHSVTAGVLLSVFSGLCYGITGVYIRKSVRSQMPVCATLFIFSAAGFLLLCPISLTILPWSDITAMTRNEWITMSIAGWFNAIAFYAITHAMKHLTISRANVINASQNAFCAIGAVVFFHEELTSIALIGIAMTIIGLLSLDRR